MEAKREGRGKKQEMKMKASLSGRLQAADDVTEETQGEVVEEVRGKRSSIQRLTSPPRTLPE